ncbi:hypothetical protein Pmani_011285 [Petrolisthes manimaculis]|uniref:Uncharacterized protein n=1 Tax=Petrolisthes manimaculis TaxID=1843537 RepID=A0AAE1Q0F4_9EUCA|nr:hypothetical protein Pmani_011285 [Petrolisthes manimaculis]
MMRELLNMAKGTPGDAGGLRGLLSLDRHPDLLSVFQSGSIEDDYEVEKEPIASEKFVYLYERVATRSPRSPLHPSPLVEFCCSYLNYLHS